MRNSLELARLPQVETGGGILADEMGMGKTLCILALILRSLEAAHEWSSTPITTTQDETTGKVKPRTRATLVVASSDRKQHAPDSLILTD